MKTEIHSLKPFLILWSTQSLSQLGSAMTSFALSLWLYGRTGSALQTALLSVCTYAPYVVMSIFAGALSDRWDKKKTMLACDTLAACCTAAVLVLFYNGQRGPDDHRLFYWAYPAHLTVLWAISALTVYTTCV